MWRALSRFALSRSRHIAGSLSSSSVTSSRKILQAAGFESSPAVSSQLLPLSSGEPARYFSDQSAVRSGDFDPAEDGASEAVEMASGESSDDSVEGLAADDGALSDTFDQQAGVNGSDVVAEAPLVINSEQLETVVSLLQGTADGSLESKLDSMGLTLQEEFVVKVLETPLIPGENLLRFFKWGLSKPSEFEVTPASIRALVQSICRGDLSKKDVYVLWDLVREIREKEKKGEEKCALDTTILNELLAAFSRMRKGRAALDVLDKFDEFGCVPDSMSYYFTINALRKRKSYELVFPVCEKMLSSGIFPEAEELGTIISWLCKGMLAKNAHSLYSAAKEKGKFPSRSAMDFLILSLCKNDETVKLGHDMLGDFDKRARKYAIKPFSAVIKGLCRSKDSEVAKKLLHEMMEAGPPPGNAVFNSVINLFSKTSEMKMAIEVKEMMESRGLKPDLFTYTVMMSGYVRGGEMEEACKLLKEAKEKHKKLSPVMYHSLIRGYCKLEEFDKALELLREMKGFGVKANADEYNKLIQSLCLKAVDSETAEKLLEEMKESGLNLNGMTRSLMKAVKELQGEELGDEELPKVEA